MLSTVLISLVFVVVTINGFQITSFVNNKSILSKSRNDIKMELYAGPTATYNGELISKTIVSPHLYN